MIISCASPKAQYLSHKAEIDAVISRVLEKGWYILGDEVKAFEEEFAEYIGVSYGIGVGSGTEAIHLALKCLSIGQGDEVITVSHTAVATVAAVELTGAKAVFVDIEPDYYTLDAEKLEAVITPKTKAVVVVHLYGQAADLDRITEVARRHNLPLIEDCAQAHGARYKGKCVGAYGKLACFSFYPTKNLGALGDGGMVVTNDTQLAQRAKLLREYGWAQRYVSDCLGWNTRLDEVQAAVLRVKLEHLDTDNAKRAKIAELYGEQLRDTGLVLPKQRKNAQHIYHLYVVRSDNRDKLSAFLKEKGIGTSIHYPVPVHLQPAYNRGPNNLPETEHAAKDILSLPMYPELTPAEIAMVTGAIKEFEKKRV
jgi:dTDP-4-amino-4,6-dideoxygalactose transaminase